MYWVNGEQVTSVALNDRSFQYGDGCFTTMLTRFGVIEHFSYHQQRINEALERLKIPAIDWSVVTLWLQQASLSDAKAGMKLHISRGSGGRGYSPSQVSSPTITITSFAFPHHYQRWQTDGLAIGICRPKLGVCELLAGIKHNNRLEQVLLKQDIEEQGFADGVALNSDLHVIETTMANVFWRKADTWYTPTLQYSGVAGVMRRHIIERMNDSGIKLQFGCFNLPHLLASDEIFITNALLGVAPIVSIENNHYLKGHQTTLLQERLESC